MSYDNEILIFEWDPVKAISNYEKHKVSFELGQLVFDDEFHLTEFNRIVGSEVRYNTLGNVDDLILFVVHCYRKREHGKKVIRLISVRKAHTQEAGRYHAKAGRRTESTRKNDRR